MVRDQGWNTRRLSLQHPLTKVRGWIPTRSRRSGGSTGPSRRSSVSCTTGSCNGIVRSARPACCGRSDPTVPMCARCASRLDLDSGYLSRVLRALEAAGLVTVGPSSADERGPHGAAHRGPGAAERALLDARSDELAASFLEPLDDRQRDRLVTSMRDVQRLLTAPLVEIGVDGSRSRRRSVLPRRVLRRARHPLRRAASIPR